MIKNIARIAKATLHKLHGKSSLNVSYVYPVSPVCLDDNDIHDISTMMTILIMMMTKVTMMTIATMMIILTMVTISTIMTIPTMMTLVTMMALRAQRILANFGLFWPECALVFLGANL